MFVINSSTVSKIMRSLFGSLKNIISVYLPVAGFLMKIILRIFTYYITIVKNWLLSTISERSVKTIELEKFFT